MPDTGVLQGVLAVQLLAALIELETGVLGVVNGLIDLHVDAAEGVNHFGQT